MASVEVRLAGATGSSVLCSGASACSGPIVIPVDARPGDSLTLTATATDTAGNVTTATRTVRVTSDGVVTGTVSSTAQAARARLRQTAVCLA